MNRWIFIVYAIASGLILLCLKHGHAAKITRKIETESKPAGGTGMLNCTVLSRSRAKLIWQKLNVVKNVSKPVVLSMDEEIIRKNRKLNNGKLKYDVVMNKAKSKGWTFSLIIRSLTSDDAGEYMCVLMIDGLPHTRYQRQIGKLVVQLPPDTDGSYSTLLVNAVEGQDAELRCRASGIPDPKISWSRPNGEALPGGQLTIYGEILKIKNVTDSSAGLYRCKADNNVRPPALLDIPLRIFHRPKVIPFRKTVGQAPDKNNEVELSCIIKADPKPDMSWWHRDTQRVLDDHKHEIHKFELPTGIMGVTSLSGGKYMTSLRIINVQTGDFGKYTCTAENIYGKDSTNIELYHTPTCQGANCLFESRSLNSAQKFQWSYFAVVLWMLTICTLLERSHYTFL